MARVTGLGHIGIYVQDPPGRPCRVPTATPIDIERPDDVVMADVDRVWLQLRHVPVGGRMAEESPTLQAAR